MENSKKKQTKTVALDARLHRELKILAVQREMDLSDLLNRAVKEFLARSGGTTERPRQGS